MKTRILLAIALMFTVYSFYGASSTIFTITNNCPYTIWPATLTSNGPQISTGFELPSKGSLELSTSPPWSGRIWGRSICTNSVGKFSCLTGDCGSGQITCNGGGAIPPASLAEFTLNGDQGRDFYDVSLVDGFNFPLSVRPTNSGCNVTSCPVDINHNRCPPELMVKNTTGDVIGCKSACAAFNLPQYCCTGDYGSPTTCKPTNYSQIFKAQCPQAYSYAFDDNSSSFTCPTGSNYVITFCP